MSGSAPSHRADILFAGAGPQALRALAELDDALAARGPSRRGPVRIVAVDPGAPGAGVVWDPGQPEHLRMNVASRIVDLSCASVPLSFDEWHRREFGLGAETHPPRALVGRYLGWAWSCLERSARLDLTHVRGSVAAIERAPEGWRARVTRTDGQRSFVAPRAVLCTGHRSGAVLDHRGLMGDNGPAAGRGVIVRGAALTAFDVVLSLTEGRGGHWVSPTGSGADELRYEPSGREPESITLVSRTGLMMLPKPRAPLPAEALAAAERLSGDWAAAPPLGREWWGRLVTVAQSLARTHGLELGGAALLRCLDGTPAETGAHAATTSAAARRWDADLRRAAGDVDGDHAWWLGRAWSTAYPEILASLERRPRHRQGWEQFLRRAARLERWAFGPPADLVSRLLALLRHGIVSVVTEAEAPPPALTDVRAYIPGPGVLRAPRPWPTTGDATGPADRRDPAHDCDSPLWAGLLAARHVTVRPGERGVLTAPDGTCVGGLDELSPGLSALGRPTEGPVIDHDSLQRALHLDARRWANAVAAEFSRTAPRKKRPR